MSGASSNHPPTQWGEILQAFLLPRPERLLRNIVRGHTCPFGILRDDQQRDPAEAGGLPRLFGCCLESHILGEVGADVVRTAPFRRQVAFEMFESLGRIAL